MHGKSHPIRRGTKLYDAIDRVGELITCLMLICGGALAVGYGSAFASFIAGVGP